ncbi:hypothetical protein [Paenibacillus sp. YPG26]|uniref:hypothetical protein n=1 Tax=Paenibacillus sp. YPG26 TaxID=2878915 RepID=UPI00203EC497|nr:hypothetical protein [Paenibacillus sp. YPG26]USB34561.1 hypothetical protein LDO05_07310 [Paenibacillus sp. YPG26]
MRNTRHGSRVALFTIVLISSLAFLNGCGMNDSTRVPGDSMFSFPMPHVPVTEDVYNPSVIEDVYSPGGEQLDNWQ